MPFSQPVYLADPSTGITAASDGPAANAAAVTPSDTASLASVSRALYVGGAGNIAFVTLGSQAVTMTAVPAGTFIPVQVTQVKATGTTATNIVAFW